MGVGLKQLRPEEWEAGPQTGPGRASAGRKKPPELGLQEPVSRLGLALPAGPGAWQESPVEGRPVTVGSESLGCRHVPGVQCPPPSQWLPPAPLIQGDLWVVGGDPAPGRCRRDSSKLRPQSHLSHSLSHMWCRVWGGGAHGASLPAQTAAHEGVPPPQLAGGGQEAAAIGSAGIALLSSWRLPRTDVLM